jgi:hypothetical protein
MMRGILKALAAELKIHRRRQRFCRDIILSDFDDLAADDVDDVGLAAFGRVQVFPLRQGLFRKAAIIHETRRLQADLESTVFKLVLDRIAARVRLVIRARLREFVEKV